MKLILNPDNPRQLTPEAKEKLKKSILSFTKMLKIRKIAYDENNIIWGGNQRYIVLQELIAEGKLKDSNDYYILMEDFTEDEKHEFAIRDNIEFGTWLDDLLKTTWDKYPLEDWGIKTYWNYEDVDVNELWKENNMPDYGDPNMKKPYRTINVHFEDKAQVSAFAKLVNEPITDKTKFIWFK